ncbi:hypothetical protein [Thermus amyloliquefaciens]|nr:hypothetical protein [Thermus amyloliquefaciens]
MTRIFSFDPHVRRAEVERAGAFLGKRPEVLAVVLFGSLAWARLRSLAS